MCLAHADHSGVTLSAQRPALLLRMMRHWHQLFMKLSALWIEAFQSSGSGMQMAFFFFINPPCFDENVILLLPLSKQSVHMCVRVCWMPRRWWSQLASVCESFLKQLSVSHCNVVFLSGKHSNPEFSVWLAHGIRSWWETVCFLMQERGRAFAVSILTSFMLSEVGTVLALEGF